jgi:hypothetical protein
MVLGSEIKEFETRAFMVGKSTPLVLRRLLTSELNIKWRNMR